MSIETVAARYAQALLELGVESGQLAAFADQVQSVADAWQQSEELRGALQSPLVSDHDREAVLQAVASRAGASTVVINTLKLLARRRRLAVLPSMARALRKLSDERAGLIRVEVRSARPLSEDYVRRLQGELEKTTGKKVVLDRKVDPALIAGVVTRVGDVVIDGSVKSRLDDLRSHLLST
ncbi:MAG TPA: ATP synthase F1 subunit delta [Polyangiaceae bacterium]|nr:ATP synthase F1 subunit delta [Polyangiaceae bacterium]